MKHSVKAQSLANAIKSWIPETKNTNKRRQKHALEMVEILRAQLKEEPDAPHGQTVIINTRTGQTVTKLNRSFTDPKEIRTELRYIAQTKRIPIDDLEMQTTHTIDGSTRKYFIPTMPDPRNQ